MFACVLYCTIVGKYVLYVCVHGSPYQCISKHTSSHRRTLTYTYVYAGYKSVHIYKYGTCIYTHTSCPCALIVLWYTYVFCCSSDSVHCLNIYCIRLVKLHTTTPFYHTVGKVGLIAFWHLHGHERAPIAVSSK